MKKAVLIFACMLTLLTSTVAAWTPPIMNGNTTEIVNQSKECADLKGKAGLVIVNGKPIVCYPTTQVDVEVSRDRTTELAVFIMFSLQVISVVVATICLVYGAIMLAVARGNPHKAQKAWVRIKLALLGVAIMGGLGAIVTTLRAMFAI